MMNCRRSESSLRIELIKEDFERLYEYTSYPIELKRPGQRIAVRVVSQFGEESMKVV